MFFGMKDKMKKHKKLKIKYQENCWYNIHCTTSRRWRRNFWYRSFATNSRGWSRSKKRKTIKNFNSKQTRLPILLALIKCYKQIIFHISSEKLPKFNQVNTTMEDNKLVMTMESKMFHFDLPQCADINLRHETYSIIKQNELLAMDTRLGN